MPDLAPGSTLASFTIEGVIGRGGMGVVYLATQKSLKRKVALKVLSSALGQDASYRERFLRECELVAKLEHPHIVPIYDAGDEGGLLYMAMRYIEGKDLRALISERGHLSSASALKIVEEVASALDAAHSLGVIHRDVKPANILIQGRDEEAYLTDFGVAKSLSSGGLTRTGTFLGTVDYCAPEQISGKPIDQRVDVYSLGGVLYHCLAGQPPYIRETEAAVINAHVSERPPAISGIRPDLPASLDGVIATAMAKEREVRYGSASELASALRAALSEDASPEGRATVVEQAPSATAPQRPPLPETLEEEAPVSAPNDRSKRKSLGKSVIAGFIIGLALVAGGVAAAITVMERSDHEKRPAVAQKRRERSVQTRTLTRSVTVVRTTSRRPKATTNEVGVPSRYYGRFTSVDRLQRCNATATYVYCSSGPSGHAVRLDVGGRIRDLGIRGSSDQGGPSMPEGTSFRTQSNAIECGSSSRGITCTDLASGAYFVLGDTRLITSENQSGTQTESGTGARFSGYFAAVDRLERCYANDDYAVCTAGPSGKGVRLVVGGGATYQGITGSVDKGGPAMSIGTSFTTPGGKITCSSSSRGITCRDVTTGDYFRISDHYVYTNNGAGEVAR
jgi:serine/threonine protein kinase